MKITFSGVPKNSKITLDLCRRAINFYASLLMSKRLSDSLELNVKFKNLKNKNDPNSPLATCYSLDVDSRPKYFEIEVDKNMGMYRTMTAIAHEMVHMKQEATGAMYQYTCNMNKVRYEKDVFDTEDIDYWDSPWEIEAYGRERGLYIRFQQHLKELKRK